MTYQRLQVEALIRDDATHLFEAYARGRPINWNCDSRTRELVCVGNWINKELTRLGAPDEDRRIMGWAYNRRSRAATDLFQLGADLMNEFEAGNIDRKPAHRRWG